MERMFPGRQRRALKNKLSREYRADAARVDAALSGGATEPAALDKLKEVAGMLRQARAPHCRRLLLCRTTFPAWTQHGRRDAT